MRPLAVSLALIATATMSVRLAAQATGCADTQFPPELPAPNALVDSAQAIADLAAFAGAKPMVFSVVFQQGDSIAQVRPLNKNDAAAAVSLANYIRRRPARDLWAVRLLIAGGDAPALTLERSKYCPPVPLGVNRRATITGTVVGSGSPPSMAPPPPVTLSERDPVSIEALISLEGRMLVARVLRTSGNAATDDRFVRDLQKQRFVPAKLDGQPIQGVYRTRGESPRP